MNRQDLRDLGFEDSKEDAGYLKVRCHSCEALVIQGHPCHETGCPEQRVECRECGSLMRRGEGCSCMDPVEDDFLSTEECP